MYFWAQKVYYKNYKLNTSQFKPIKPCSNIVYPCQCCEPDNDLSEYNVDPAARAGYYFVS